ncbi:MAG TPA: hypothetical protein VLB27_04875 [candidate division Zixibacteria bacterium]|nr:hypothetical protein [candidate division Zixibacteria bacterium]
MKQGTRSAPLTPKFSVSELSGDTRSGLTPRLPSPASGQDKRADQQVPAPIGSRAQSVSVDQNTGVKLS